MARKIASLATRKKRVAAGIAFDTKRLSYDIPTKGSGTGSRFAGTRTEKLGVYSLAKGASKTGRSFSDMQPAKRKKGKKK